MKIITDSDFTIPVKLFYNNVPLLVQDCSTLSLDLYTTVPDISIHRSLSDIDASGFITVESVDIAEFPNGVLYYRYYGKTINDKDFAGVYQTEYYIKINEERHRRTCATAVSELINDVPYAPKQ